MYLPKPNTYIYIRKPYIKLSRSQASCHLSICHVLKFVSGAIWAVQAAKNKLTYHLTYTKWQQGNSRIYLSKHDLTFGAQYSNAQPPFCRYLYQKGLSTKHLFCLACGDLRALHLLIFKNFFFNFWTCFPLAMYETFRLFDYSVTARQQQNLFE